MFTELVLDERAPGREIVIYQAPVSLPKIFPLKLVGIFILLLSLVGFLATLTPLLWAEVGYRVHQTQIKQKTEQKNLISFFGQLLWLDEQKLTSPADWQFSLLIPKIGVNSRISPQVNPNNKEEYSPYLKIGVAQAQGTAFPDSPGTTYIFGHSSSLLWDANRGNAVFYLLKNLEKNDQVIVFYQGQRYEYQVVNKEILKASQVPDYVSQNTEKLLVLQTCWPPGTDWKRLFVLAEPNL